MRGFVGLVLGGLFVLQLTAGCSGDDDAPPAKDTEGLRMCCELGAICHHAGPQEPDISACHILGHENDPAACRENYDRCKSICLPDGEGGQGGEPEEHACVE